MPSSSQERRRAGERGQALVLITAMLGLLALFAGLSIDVGSAYVTRARLSRAVDAASLVAVRNLALGQGRAQQAARDAFTANYTQAGGTDRPSVDVTFRLDADRNTAVSVTATTVMETAFLGVIPQLKTLDVGATAEATRALLVMALALDRSGSMVSNGGWQSLAPAVDNFIDRFDDGRDRVAMATFATTVRVDVPMRTNFIAEIKRRAPRVISDFEGFTNSPGGLQAGFDEVRNAAIVTPEKPTKVVVFFTDGLANTFPYSASCSGFSAFALAEMDDPWYGLLRTDSELSPYCAERTAPPDCCPSLDTFTSVDGSQKTTTAAHILAEAKARALKIARDMRAADITVYSVGLGGSAVDQAFLRQIANDESAAGFDGSQPVGEAFFPQDPSELQGVFQAIASRILLRLSK
jgi:Flp pilus assembly protein TadG